MARKEQEDELDEQKRFLELTDREKVIHLRRHSKIGFLYPVSVSPARSSNDPIQSDWTFAFGRFIANMICLVYLQRALAAERRRLLGCLRNGESKPVLLRCFDCAIDITGKVPFEYNQNKFCSTRCLAAHRKKFPIPLSV